MRTRHLLYDFHLIRCVNAVYLKQRSEGMCVCVFSPTVFVVPFTGLELHARRTFAINRIKLRCPRRVHGAISFLTLKSTLKQALCNHFSLENIDRIKFQAVRSLIEATHQL